MDRDLNMSLDNPNTHLLLDVPEPGDSTHLQAAQSRLSLLRSSPKKRATLHDDEPIDPNEPVYCFCNQVSFGEMIACDNPNCGREWFHYPCVGLESPPKGKWYCRECEPLVAAL